MNNQPSVELRIFRDQLKHLMEEGHRVLLHLPNKEQDTMQKSLNNVVIALTYLDKIDA